jgi:hypothetical protein
MNDEHVLAFVKAVDWTDFYAIHIFTFDAVIDDDVSQFITPDWRSRALIMRNPVAVQEV